jgi:DNA end-binding protein Ku
MFFEKPYYLVPVKKAEKGYVLLREALKKTGKVAIGRVVIRTRQYLAMMFPKDDALVLNLLRFPQEIVDQEEFAFPSGALAKFRITAAEMKMAEDLLKSMAGKWAPTDYKDEFRDKLRKMIQQRIDKEQGTLTIPQELEEHHENASTNVVDFVSLLKKSLSGGKGGAKSAAKKSPAKRARAHARRKRA